MTRILSIDTTSNFGSIALLEDGVSIEEFPLYSSEGFSHYIFDAIDRLLHRHEWALRSITAFASASGPGSFTGVRVGLTAIKGLAESCGRPAFGVSNLLALAAGGSGTNRAVVMDARRGEVYAAVYDRKLHEVCPETVTGFPQWIRNLPVPIDEIISPDYSPFQSASPNGIPVVEQRNLAAAIAGIAATRLTAGDPGDPAELDANYVRRSDAELFWVDK